MQTSKRGALIIGICCVIIYTSYTYYKNQYRSTLESSTYQFKSTPPREGVMSTSTFVVGETKQVNGISVTLKSIDQDSRCPKDVQCIQAGNVVAHITVVSPSETKEFYPSSVGSVGDGYYAFSIVDTAPHKQANQQIKQSDYKIILAVTTK